MTVGSAPPPAMFDADVAHPARVYDYLLGGKDNFAADREAGDNLVAIRPRIADAIKANRSFTLRSVRYLAEDCGIRQFLDIGTGIPAAPNAHEIAQAAAPACRVVCVDNDPLVIVHAQARLASSPEGTLAIVDADLRDPDAIIRAAAPTLDFTRPVAVLLSGVLHLIPDEDLPHDIVAHLLGAVPPGSYLAASHPASDIDADVVAVSASVYNHYVSVSLVRRSYPDVLRLFGGLELAEPGLVQCHQWRPDPSVPGPEGEVPVWAAVGRKLARAQPGALPRDDRAGGRANSCPEDPGRAVAALARVPHRPHLTVRRRERIHPGVRPASDGVRPLSCPGKRRARVTARVRRIFPEGRCGVGT
jgi:S-adenosyl methyltransferase